MQHTKGTRRILVVEDNFDAAESLQMLVSMLRHEVIVAHSGIEALQKAREGRPDVVLRDIGLPGDMDGYDIALAMRADPALSSTSLIAMTGFGQEEDRYRALEAGFDHHLTKPADLDMVERRLSV